MHTSLCRQARRATRALGEICVPACMWLRLPTRIPPVHILLASRSTGQRNTTQSRLFSCALPARMCAMAIALACPHPPRTHAPRPHTQTGPPVSATRPSLVLFSRALCARMCAIAIALAQQHPPSSPPAALPSLPPSWLTTSSSPAFTSVRWSDSSTQAAAAAVQSRVADHVCSVDRFKFSVMMVCWALATEQV